MIQCSAIFIVGNLFIYVVDAGLDYICSIYTCARMPSHGLNHARAHLNTHINTLAHSHQHMHTVSNRMLYGTNSQAGYFQCIAPSNVGVCYFGKKRERITKSSGGAYTKHMTASVQFVCRPESVRYFSLLSLLLATHYFIPEHNHNLQYSVVFFLFWFTILFGFIESFGVDTV